ncbi:unnamed protein product, partial [marine sediment metagenome]
TIEFGYASLDEIKELYSNPQMDLKVYQWEFLKEKLTSGTWKCTVVKYGGKLIAYGFYSIKEMALVGTKKVSFDLPTQSVYFFRLFVHPDFRKLYVSKSLYNFRINEVRCIGNSLIFCAVNSTNQIQIHNLEKIGWKLVGSIIFLKTKISNTVFISRKISKFGLKLKH